MTPHPTDNDSPLSEVPTRPEPPDGPSFGAKVKQFFNILLLMAIAGGALYGFGWWQGNVKLSDQKAEHDRALTGSQEEALQAQTALRTEQSKSRLLLARAALLQAAFELDDRNFGTANTQVQDAVKAIAEVTESTQPDKLKAMQQELGTIEINFAINPEAQKKRLVALANQITPLLPN